jgi:hypothetical protein
MFFKNFFKKNDFTPKEAFMRAFSTSSSEYLEIATKDDVLFAYLNCPTVRAIVDKKTELFSNFQLKEISPQGIELKNTPFLNVLAKPHPLYSEGEFWQTLGKQWELFDEVFIYVERANIGGLIAEGDTFLILTANDVKININEKYNPKEKNSNLIDSYDFYFKGKKLEFKPSEIIHVSKTALNSKNWESVDLRLKSCEGAINTILASYNVTTTLLNRNGGFFIFTNDAGDGGLEFNREIEKDEIENLQKDLKNYTFSRDGNNAIITNAKLKVQSISYPIKDMDLDNMNNRAITDICNVLNFPILALNSLNGSTFNNLEITDKKIYTDSIIPSWKIWEAVFNEQNFSLNTIKFDFSDINNLLDNKKIELETKKINDDIQINRYNNKLISLNELRVAIGLEEIAGGNYFFNSEEKNKKI